MYSHFDSNIWVTPFGLIFILAILTAWAYTRRNATISRIDASHIDILMPIAVIVPPNGFGVVGFAKEARFDVDAGAVDTPTSTTTKRKPLLLPRSVGA